MPHVGARVQWGVWCWLDSARDARTGAGWGAEVHRRNLNDPESLRRGAAESDGVIHCAFDHSAFGGDFSTFVEVCDQDRHAIEALGDALRGSDCPLVITSGTGMGTPARGQPATEDHFDANHPNPRKALEVAAASVAAHGVNLSIVRLPRRAAAARECVAATGIVARRVRRVILPSRPCTGGEYRTPSQFCCSPARADGLVPMKSLSDPVQRS